MKFLYIFIFTLHDGHRIKIASRSMQQALKTLQKLSFQKQPIIHLEIRIRILLPTLYDFL